MQATWHQNSPSSGLLLQVRCLVDVPGEKLPSVASGELAAYLESHVAPQVPEQLRNAFVTAIHADRLRSMLNKQMTLAPLHRLGPPTVLFTRMLAKLQTN